MNIVIIEDEKASSAYLKKIVQRQFPQLSITAICDNVPDAVQALKTHNPDIVYLDVEIKMGTGFDVLKQAPDRTFEVIFTTAFNNFAIEAFRHHAVDYLLKPLQAVQVVEATERCLERLKVKTDHSNISKLLEQLQQPATQKIKLPVYTPDGIELLETADIVYAEAKSNYTDLWLKTGKKITASRKLKEIEDNLPPQLFFRIHHSFIVNLQYVARYQRGRGGYVILQNGSSLPVSSARKEEFLAWLK